MQPSICYTAAIYYEEYTFISFIAYMDPVLIHPHTTELIMGQLDLHNSYCYEWGVIYVVTSTPSPTIRFEVTDRHLCSMGSDRNYSSISIGVLHHAYHVTYSEVNALHLYSMGSDRRYSGISIRVLYHVTYIIFSFVNTYPFLQNGE